MTVGCVVNPIVMELHVRLIQNSGYRECYVGPAVGGAHEVELADLTLNTLYSLYEPGEYP